MVDDGCHATDDFPVAHSEEQIGLAELEGGILLAIERLQHVLQKIWHGIRIALVQVVVETNEGAQVFATFHFFDTNHGSVHKNMLQR